MPHLGLRIEAIRFFTIAGPNDFLLLTTEQARALGIDVFEQDGLKVTTVDIYAGRFVSYGMLCSRCEGFLLFDKGIVERETWKQSRRASRSQGTTPGLMSGRRCNAPRYGDGGVVVVVQNGGQTCGIIFSDDPCDHRQLRKRDPFWPPGEQLQHALRLPQQSRVPRA
ncbi:MULTISPECIES: hypothetical protein [Phyllobacteriaceae]|uniref:hypothetical protein n=1 Tax=Phyllobacteriaceae TaxID=69277 RepID=UPI0018EC0164|nr:MULTISPECIES: hypothetical protein [Phyllobacteriaceae]